MRRNEGRTWYCYLELILAQNVLFKVSMLGNMQQTFYDHLVAKCSLEDVMLQKLTHKSPNTTRLFSVNYESLLFVLFDIPRVSCGLIAKRLDYRDKSCTQMAL